MKITGNPVRERLISYLKQAHLSKSDFCRHLGVSVSYVNQIRVSIAPLKVEIIRHEFPNLNTDWLLTGNGKMLNPGYTLIVDYDNILEALLSYTGLTVRMFADRVGIASQNLYNIKSGNKAFSKSMANRITSVYPEIRSEWIITGKGPMIEDHTKKIKGKKQSSENELLQLLRATNIQLAQAQDIISKNADNLTAAHNEIDRLLMLLNDKK